MRNLVLAIILVLAALGSTHAQTANPAASITAPSGAPSTAANSSETDPALSLRGMPCSVALNATGGISRSGGPTGAASLIGGC